MSVSRTVIELFYDVVSPYSWLGFEVLCRYRTVWNIELKLRPAFLGGVMKASGNRPPAMVPNKGQYLMKDLEKAAEYFNVPVRQPGDAFKVMFEKGSIAAMRFLTAVQQKEKDGEGSVERVSRELWKRIWSTDQDICEPVSLSEAGLRAGLSSTEVEELLKLSESQPIKDKLKQTTQEAINYKAFGFPFVVCHVNGNTEVFFGSDRFELMAHVIGEKWLGPQPNKYNSKL